MLVDRNADRDLRRGMPIEALAVVFNTSYLAYLPRAALSAVIMVIAVQHIDPWTLRLAARLFQPGCRHLRFGLPPKIARHPSGRQPSNPPVSPMCLSAISVRCGSVPKPDAGELWASAEF